jgi:TIR domain
MPNTYGYSVYLSYTPEDAGWVEKQLIPILDQNRITHIEEKSFTPGRPKLLEREKAAKWSRRTLLLLSPDYLENMWRQFESCLVISYGLEIGQFRAIPVILRPCDRLPPRYETLVTCDFTTDDQEAAYKRLLDALIVGPDERIDPSAILANGTATTTTSSGRAAAEGLEVLVRLMRLDQVREAVVKMRGDLEAAHTQIDVVLDLKRLHDALHNLQVYCFDQVARDLGRFPDDPNAEEVVKDSARKCKKIVDEVRLIVGRARLRKDEDLIKFLGRTIDSFEGGRRNADALSRKKSVETALYWLNRVLNLYPPLINHDLVGAVRELKLPDLWRAVVYVRDELKQAEVPERDVALFEEGVLCLARLDRDVATLMKEHDRWQDVDTELRRIQNDWEGNPEELDRSWDDLSPKIEELCRDAQEINLSDLSDVRDDFDDLKRAVDGKADASTKKRAFRSLRKSAGERFFYVDAKLKETCEDLGEVGSPLAAVLRLLG